MRFALVLFLFVLFNLPAKGESLWSHNGSTVSLVADGDSRKFYYHTPRVGLDVKAGTLLFSGKKDGSRYSGSAYVFSKECGPAAYEVSGTVAEDQRSVSMQGKAPRRDNNCAVIGYRDDVLLFSFLNPINDLQSSLSERRKYRYDHTENPIITGMICVQGSEDDVRQITSALQQYGANGKRSRDRDGHCWSGGLAIDVPEGLESWFSDSIRKQGYRVSQGGGTAGGSGDIRVFLKPDQVFSETPTPLNLPSVKKDVECKIKAAFDKYFSEVNPRACQGVTFPDGLCWKMTLTGHTAKSAGFNPAKLNRRISDKYWFRTRVELWMGYFPRYFTLDNQDLGPKVKVHLSVGSSDFARSPPNRTPNEYRSIDQFESISADELDVELNERLMEIFQESPLVCPLNQ